MACLLLATSRMTYTMWGLARRQRRLYSLLRVQLQTVSQPGNGAAALDHRVAPRRDVRPPGAGVLSARASGPIHRLRRRGAALLSRPAGLPWSPSVAFPVGQGSARRPVDLGAGKRPGGRTDAARVPANDGAGCGVLFRAPGGQRVGGARVLGGRMAGFSWSLEPCMCACARALQSPTSRTWRTMVRRRQMLWSLL